MRGSRCGASIASLMTATRIPRMSPSSHEAYRGTGSRADIRSFASNPATASSSSAQSATDRAIGPAVSWFQLLAIIPCVLTRPSVGRMPTAPLHDAGRRIEPPVSSASDPAQRPAATAMPEPVLDPPASCSRFHGLRGCPYGNTHVTGDANSVMLSLPSITAPRVVETARWASRRSPARIPTGCWSRT